jgi:GNAT superfamily N-acetyltransferase
MTIRLLQSPAELEQARALHAESESCGALHPGASLVGCVTYEGEVIGVLGIESVVFLGPVVVRRDWRGKQLPAQLVEFVRERIPAGERVAVHTRSGHVSRLAREFGMTRMSGEFWMMEVI